MSPGGRHGSVSALGLGGHWSGRGQCCHVVGGQSSNGESAAHLQGACVVVKKVKVSGRSGQVAQGNRVVYGEAWQGCWR